MANSKVMAKKALSIILTLALLVTMMSGTAIPVAAVEEPVTFKTLAAGHYYQEGMPLFDGNPDHLEAYLDTYLDWVGLEGAALYATGIRDAYQLTQGERSGWILPGGLAAADNVQGISTDFPSLVGLGQSWNKELLAKVGDVMGSEKMATLLGEFTVNRNNHNGRLYDGTGNAGRSATIAFSVVHDLRINPLSGRIDESYAEDPVLAGILIDEMAKGFIDYDNAFNGDGFYTRGVIATKHFSVYNAQWYRQTSSTSAGARSIYEYNIRSALKGLISGSLAGVMNSYGRTNGIPNELAAYNLLANSLARYGMYSSPDFNGENQMYGTGMGNGYDTQYVPDRDHALALMSLANTESVRASGTDKSDPMRLYNMVKAGIYGITEEDVRESAKPLLAQMVRAGLFDEVDDDGFSKYYPYVNEFKDKGAVSDYERDEHQGVALQAARESAVLLKNEGNTLPLSTGESVAVAGVYADSRFKTTYSVSNTPKIEEAGTAPLAAIRDKYPETVVTTGDTATLATTMVSFSLSVPVVAIKTSDGRYFTAVPGDADTTAGREGEFKGTQVTASASTCDPATGKFDDTQLFEMFDWGQGAYSFRSVVNKRWLAAPSVANASVGNTERVILNLTESDWNLATMSGNTSTIPPRLQLKDLQDGKTAIVSNAYGSGFGGGFERAYWNARFYDLTEEGRLVTSATTTSQNNTPTPGQIFEIETIKELSADILTQTDKDAALIFVGAIPRNSAGEGADRSTLNMGDNDYRLVEEAAAAFKAAGKKTVVVLKTSFPVNAEAIQNNPNVDAILYQPYAGQYDAKALAEILYGDYAPTGRLTSTWYSSDDALPDISRYSIPEGNTYTLEQHDPRITKDMSNADAYDLSLTYMYADPATVTYPFGYGLGYSDFVYSDFNVSGASGEKSFTVTVWVTNTGTVDTSEVVQLYAKNMASAYGDDSVGKRLAAFEKVFIEAGKTRMVTLTVDPEDLEIWDVNSAAYIVENGNYRFEIGSSAYAIKEVIEEVSLVDGKAVATLDPKVSFNVFDHAYAANDVVYNEVSKKHTSESLKGDLIAGGYSAVMSKSGEAWVAIPNVDVEGIKRLAARVATNGTPGNITLSLDRDVPFAAISVPVTEAASYTLYDVEVRELEYTEVAVELPQSLTGTHTLYVNFEGADLRIDSIQMYAEDMATVSFNVNGGSALEAITKAVGAAIETAPVTTRPGYTFEGWYSDEALTLKVGFPYTLGSESITWYAKWQQISSGSGSGSGSGTAVKPPFLTSLPGVTAQAAVLGEKEIQTVEAAVARASQEAGSGVSLQLSGTPFTLDLPYVTLSYVRVKLILPSGVDSKRMTTLARLNSDGSLTPVPTTVDGNSATVIVKEDSTLVPLMLTSAFTDLSGHYGASEIGEAAARGYVVGVGNGKYLPDTSVNAAETYTMFLKALGIAPDGAAKALDGVSQTAWYADEMNTAAKHNLYIEGVSPEEPMTRINTATLIAKALKELGMAPTLTLAESKELLKGFSDLEELTDAQRMDLGICVKLGVFVGNGDGTMGPNDSLLRVHMAAVAVRALDGVLSAK